MADDKDIDRWFKTIQDRYMGYLSASFYFRNARLRSSFQTALKGDKLLKGPIPEADHAFKMGSPAKALAEECFPNSSGGLTPGLLDGNLYSHQEKAIRTTHTRGRNVVIATGTSSGKTESFLYPILFSLYEQHLAGKLQPPGVRALVLYSMNALANDQRERLGGICERLAHTGFRPTFGQYTGQTPEDRRDTYRKAAHREENRLPNELVYRKEMRENPPHILLTNYSMLEYLLIRPNDSPLFDDDRGKTWEFIVLDEAHQYRGAKGMEMGMLLRRLKQRLRDGGRADPFRCIATSATIVSGTGESERLAVARFAQELFGEEFADRNVIFGERENPASEPGEAAPKAKRQHIFVRALEGAFLVHKNGTDEIVLNRESSSPDGATPSVPLEIALCKECGQHYYVGRNKNGSLVEAVRDRSQTDFGVEYYLPDPQDDADRTHWLCKCCGSISVQPASCTCNASIPVMLCKSDDKNPDQIKKCESCGYQRGGIGDPVQEIVHGSDGPNAVIATALQELLPAERRKVLAFADSRQEAAFFAWYFEDSHQKLRNRNLIYRALQRGGIPQEGLTINDLLNRLERTVSEETRWSESESAEGAKRRLLTMILEEILTSDRRLSLSGVGLAKWTVKCPSCVSLLEDLTKSPWHLRPDEVSDLLSFLLDQMRVRLAIELPDREESPQWSTVAPDRLQRAYSGSRAHTRSGLLEWGHKQSSVVSHYFSRLLSGEVDDRNQRTDLSVDLMKRIWGIIRDFDKSAQDKVLLRVRDDAFRLNPNWVRVQRVQPGDIHECDTCGTVSYTNIRGICPRHKCRGNLIPADIDLLGKNHYRRIYESERPLPALKSEEHTAQIESDTAWERQDDFKNGKINLLSSSTTFEVGVDLGDLDVVFLRNVPPEPFNYTQRVGRAGRRGQTGIAVTYCRRSPHDLYHFANPEDRIIRGEVYPPRFVIKNDKIILRHITAVALAAFFKCPGNQDRFGRVENLVFDWESPRATADLRHFCQDNPDLEDSLRQIVPGPMHAKVGIDDGSWIEKIAGSGCHYKDEEEALCHEYRKLCALHEKLAREKDSAIARIQRRIKTIESEKTLTFLSRRAIIPKYGFPVDVVELDTRSVPFSKTIQLQRDRSQAIAEYAPGSKVVANKREWESVGVKTIVGKALPTKFYKYDDARNFVEADEQGEGIFKEYVIPEYGFVGPLESPKAPTRKGQRLYTSRPFFCGFKNSPGPEFEINGIGITPATPGNLVILCEGHDKKGFHVCLACGRHMREKGTSHKSPEGQECSNTTRNYSYGHKLITDVVRLGFPGLTDPWDAYSLAFAVMMGASEILNVPETDLNATITGMENERSAIILYDNVPGGAGLVEQLIYEKTFRAILGSAQRRMQGDCGCQSSCYGCLRSYRNQFAHPYLDRTRALWFIETALGKLG